ncbi:hypothetical protein C9374_004570 [Naegleria lovaniensis]|uniref:Uncharacterized protein n=1 Tax=Naegleria lovaniensis TaxID=51637 RepID=A0AA88GSA4_NAELO|nr:uncharacterized protein C9374_004570 [Naegleria lovaniensis]KAG2383233.1 hypothetical protein C9374_004570 [Naegleria lovaniensis]
MMQHEKLKICVIGNSKCGKTSLILSYLESDRELPHTTLDEITSKIIYQGHEISLTISDTNGSDDYDRYRTRVMYPHSDSDLRDDHRYISNTSHIVSRQEVRKLLIDSQLDPAAYMECSVYDQGVGVKEVFDKALELYFFRKSNNTWSHHHHKSSSHHINTTNSVHSSNMDKKKK